MAIPVLTYDSAGMAAPAGVALGSIGQTGALAAAPYTALASGLGAVSIAADKIQQVRNDKQISGGLLDASGQLDDARAALAKDPDTAGRAAKFGAAMDKVKAASLAKLEDPRAADAFETRFNVMAKTMQHQIKTDAQAEETQQARLALVDNVEGITTKAVFAKSQAERDALLGEASEMVKGAVASGTIGAVAAHQVSHAVLGKFDGALAAEQVRRNPAGAIADLGDPGKYTFLDAAQRVALRSQAQNRLESLGAQASAELHADVQSYVAARAAGQPVDPAIAANLARRAGGSPVGKVLANAAKFYDAVDANTLSQSPAQMRENITRLENGQPGMGTATTLSNLPAADAALKLTPQEKALYQRHLTNLTGPGGVDNGDGSRSTLFQMSVEHDGKTYNLPTVYDGKKLSTDEAVERARKIGWDKFPSYASEKEAEDRYQQMHQFMDKDTGAYFAARKANSAPSLQDLAVARVVKKVAGAATEVLQKDFNRQFATFEQVAKAGEPYQDLGKLKGTAFDLGGAPLVQYVEQQNDLYGRLRDASKEDAPRVQARIEALNAQRAPDGTLNVDQIHEVSALKTALGQKITQRDADPAAYALKYNPTIGETLSATAQAATSQDASDRIMAADQQRSAYAALLDAQRRDGVPEHKLALLPKSAAEQLYGQLVTAQGQAQVDLVNQLQGQYGEHWPRVVAQLSNGHPLPGALQLTARLPADANLDKVMLTEAFKFSDKQATEVLGGPKMKEIDDAVRGKAADMLAATVQAPDGPAFAASYQEAAEKLARLYVARNATVGEAATKAFDQVFYNHFDVVGTVRVPKVDGQPVATGDAVRTAQRTVIDGLGQMDLALPTGMPKAQYVNHLKSFGTWQTGPNDDGMFLIAGPGNPVRFADGQLVFVPFDSANALGEQGAAVKNLYGRRRDRALLEMQNIPVPDSFLGSDPAPGAVTLLPDSVNRLIKRTGQGFARDQYDQGGY